MSRPTSARAAVVAASSFLVGGCTSFAQGFLPDSVASFANSASGWTLVTVLLLMWARVLPAVAALLGATSFVLLTVGYSAAAQLRDQSYDPRLFVVVGVVVGPFVGVATTWLRAAHPWQVSLGTALLAGIGLGEAVYGLTTVADTTSPVYWLLIGAAALALLVAVLLRIGSTLWALLTVCGTSLVAGAFLVSYRWLGGA